MQHLETVDVNGNPVTITAFEIELMETTTKLRRAIGRRRFDVFTKPRGAKATFEFKMSFVTNKDQPVVIKTLDKLTGEWK